MSLSCELSKNNFIFTILIAMTTFDISDIFLAFWEWLAWICLWHFCAVINSCCYWQRYNTTKCQQHRSGQYLDWNSTLLWQKWYLWLQQQIDGAQNWWQILNFYIHFIYVFRFAHQWNKVLSQKCKKSVPLSVWFHRILNFCDFHRNGS